MPKDDPRDLMDWLGFRAAPNFARARWIGAGVSVLLSVLFVLALVAAFMVLVHTIGQAGNTATEGPNLGAGALIAALLGAPFLIWGTWLKYQTVRYQKEGHITDRINKAVEQLGAEKTVKVRGQDADGKEVNHEETRPNIEVRIGAILSLERIAQDSTTHDKGRDHVRVMEILCAYVRENSNARKPVDFPEPEWESLKDGASVVERAVHEEKLEERFGPFYSGSKAWEWARTLPKPRADVALVLKVIGRRTVAQRRAEAAWPEAPDETTLWPFDRPCPRLPDEAGEAALSSEALEDFRQRLKAWQDTLAAYKGYRLGLTGANLQRADLAATRPDASDAVFGGARLSGTRLEGANLGQARMEGANLGQARMEGASLWQARMEGASLGQARMEGADLGQARMEGAYLGEARMEGADLRQARMEGAYLGEARMEGASLWQARMEGAHLIEARMEGASLGGARMEGADLKQARMEGADLRRARMEGADLRGVVMDGRTDLKDAALDGASMRFVDLREVAITQAQLGVVFADGSMAGMLPEGANRPAHWPVWVFSILWDPSFDDELARWRAEGAAYRPPLPPGGG